VIIVCSKDQRNTATVTREGARRRLITERVDMASRELNRDLRRKATIPRFDDAA
jgi:peptidyl-prolyl cis-trans isomerase SurA